ncbi:MIP aquaporin [Asimina triloba]
MGKFLLVLSDVIISFMWVWSTALIEVLVHQKLRIEMEPRAEILEGSLAVVSMFVLAWLGKITKGGSYNPLTVLPGAISGSFSGFLFTMAVRIPSQVIGSLIGVQTIIDRHPEVGHGHYHLKVDIHRGALTEGILTFTMVMVYLGAAKSDPNNVDFESQNPLILCRALAFSIMTRNRTFILLNVALSPAMAWAYAQGDPITKEHLLVYWLAPLEATLLGVWTFKLLVPPQKPQKQRKEEKAEEKRVKSE